MNREPVSVERIADDLWRLVRVPSPTGHEREAALLYAELLTAAGGEVELDESIRESPSVIGRLRGGRRGPSIQLAGHIDHIDVPHPEASRTGEIIRGRGAADMKAGLACILEIVRWLAGLPEGFPGEALVTVYGLHEAPRGRSEGLMRLIERGVTGDAAIVFEGPPEGVVVCGKGQSVWTLTLERPGEASHELRRPAGADALIDAVAAVVQALRAEDGRLSRIAHDLLGPESLFIGQLHYGDFYNRSPRSCTLQGTRRWHPGRTFEDAQAGMADLLAATALPAGITATVAWTFVGESFAVDPGERIVKALQAAFWDLRGVAPRPAGVAAVLDTSRLVPFGRVPTVPIDCDGATGHADDELVRLPVVAEACRLARETVRRYLAMQPEGPV